jgi:hypothetical protein
MTKKLVINRVIANYVIALKFRVYFPAVLFLKLLQLFPEDWVLPNAILLHAKNFQCESTFIDCFLAPSFCA